MVLVKKVKQPTNINTGLLNMMGAQEMSQNNILLLVLMVKKNCNNRGNRGIYHTQIYILKTCNPGKRILRKIFDDYHKALHSWTSINARFPLKWASPDKTAHQTTLCGFILLPALDYEDNRDLHEIPLDLERHQTPARLVSPRWK